jgi:hypothetical protein
MENDNQTYKGAIKDASQALERISELDKIVTTEGELAVSYQQHVWLPRFFRFYILAMIGGMALGGIISHLLKWNVGYGVLVGMGVGLLFMLIYLPVSSTHMNSGKSKNPAHIHHNKLVKAQKETYSLIKNEWKPNIAFLKKYSRKNPNGLGEYEQLCMALIDADTLVKTLTLTAKTAKLMKANAASSMRTALKLAAVAGIAVIAMAGIVDSASSEIGGTRYKVTYDDGTTSYETR